MSDVTTLADPSDDHRREADAIFDELRDYEQCFIHRPSAIADRYDELHRQLGLLAAFYGLNLPPAIDTNRGAS